jgi:hypothetical protein
VWTPKGLTRFVVLFFIELSTRRVEVGGIASKANGLWMIQIARNLTDGVDGFFEGKRYLIHDRDPLYTQQFLTMLGEAVHWAGHARSSAELKENGGRRQSPTTLFYTIERRRFFGLEI